MTELAEWKPNQQSTLRGLIDMGESSTQWLVTVPGFERTCVEPKFTVAKDLALSQGYSCFRFDFSGCGLSDGGFETITVERQTQELVSAISYLKTRFEAKSISLFAHSLGACIALKAVLEQPEFISKLILLAPAFNQKELLVYWFVQSQHKDKSLNWKQVAPLLNKDDYEVWLSQKRMTKAHWLQPTYNLENRSEDYSRFMSQVSVPMLIIHGTHDLAVPKESYEIPSQPKVSVFLVSKGDHELERPDLVAEYSPLLADFLA